MTGTNWVYTEQVKDHFINPRNILDDPESYNEDGKGMTGNIKCGDEMLFVIKVDKEKGIIADCKWKTFGCASAIASTSKLSEMVVGMKVEDAYRIQPDEIIKELGGLPDKKVHCSVLGDKALRAAIEDYYRRNGMEDKIKITREMVICNCMNVTDQDIEDAVLHGADSWEELQKRTKIGTVCGECKDEALVVLQNMIDKYKK